MNRRAPLRRLIVIVASGLLTLSCGSLPRDPEGTLHRARGGRLRVGLVEHPPWVVRTEGEPAGAEVVLVRRFAAELNATPDRSSSSSWPSARTSRRWKSSAGGCGSAG